MSTAAGCTVWLAVFVAALLLERALLEPLGLPGGGTVLATLAVLLARGVTLTAGSLHGLLLALRQRAGSMARPAQWRDGETVRVEGVLEPAGETLQAPFSGRPAVYLGYGARATGGIPRLRRACAAAQPRRPRASGSALPRPAACALPAAPG